jgi:hypothetical protein
MNPTQALISAIERDLGGVAVVWCPDLGLRDWLIKEVEGLAEPGAQPIRTTSVAEAIQTPHRMVLLVPQDERAVVDELEGCRDQLLADPPRTQPVVLFLLREGASGTSRSRIVAARALDRPRRSRTLRSDDPGAVHMAAARCAPRAVYPVGW